MPLALAPPPSPSLHVRHPCSTSATLAPRPYLRHAPSPLYAWTKKWRSSVQRQPLSCSGRGCDSSKRRRHTRSAAQRTIRWCAAASLPGTPTPRQAGSPPLPGAASRRAARARARFHASSSPKRRRALQGSTGQKRIHPEGTPDHARNKSLLGEGGRKELTCLLAHHFAPLGAASRAAAAAAAAPRKEPAS